jgi:spore coat protein YsxE
LIIEFYFFLEAGGEMEKNLSIIQKIASYYGIRVHYMEQFGKVTKLYSDVGNFALKKIHAQNGIDFVQNMKMIYQQGYNRIVPIYPTLDGRYSVLEGNALFYLTPWLSNEGQENGLKKHQQFFRELARLHTISVKEIEIEKEERKEHYEETTSQWEQDQAFLDEFLEECEKEWYMSPFQLLFCTYYHEIKLALQFAQKKFDEWFEDSKELAKARTVMIHGKTSIDHFIYDEQGYGYFTNLERARRSSPIHDLLPFIAKSLNTYPKQADELLEGMQLYLRYFPFNADEMLLFTSYLAYPVVITQTVKKYFYQLPKRNELKDSKALQRNYWQLKNTEYMIMRLTEYERTKNNAQD